MSEVSFVPTVPLLSEGNTDLIYFEHSTKWYKISQYLKNNTKLKIMLNNVYSNVVLKNILKSGILFWQRWTIPKVWEVWAKSVEKKIIVANGKSIALPLVMVFFWHILI